MGVCEFYTAYIALMQRLWRGKRRDGFPKKNTRKLHWGSGVGTVKGVMDFPRKTRANCIEAAALAW
jgi:hypothetical protein